VYTKFGNHFVIGRRFDRSSPYVMWLMVNFANWRRTEAYNKGIEEKEHLNINYKF
jgi:hypothetical protein